MSTSDITHELDAISSDVTTLQRKLTEINNEKEAWFKKKEDLKVKINELVKELREQKKTNDTSSSAYSELKKERDKYNSQVKSLITNLKKLNEQKQDVFAKYNIKNDPSNIKERMDRLEKTIETEALSFKKEQGVMEQIKKLRKQYDESKKVSEVVEKASQVAKELHIAKEKANEFHKQLIAVAKEKGYGAFIELTKQINVLRREQEAAFNMFIKMKNEFAKISVFLKAKMMGQKQQHHNERKKEDNLRQHEETIKRSKSDAILKEKIDTIEHKLKSKGKLTTEDLIALQGRK